MCEYQIQEILKRRIGVLPHVLQWSYVCDCHTPDGGPVSGAEYMAFINRDYSLREFHGFFNNYPPGPIP